MTASFFIGDRVRLSAAPPYFKTAEPMPMLRPPDILRVGAEGIVLDQRPGGYWGVKFNHGAFLVDERYLESVSMASTSPESASPKLAPTEPGPSSPEPSPTPGTEVGDEIDVPETESPSS